MKVLFVYVILISYVYMLCYMCVRFLFLLLIFEAESHYMPQAIFELTILFQISRS